MEPLANAIRLRTLGLGATVIDVFQIEIQGVFVMFPVAAILAAPVGQDA